MSRQKRFHFTGWWPSGEMSGRGIVSWVTITDSRVDRAMVRAREHFHSEAFGIPGRLPVDWVSLVGVEAR